MNIHGETGKRVRSLVNAEWLKDHLNAPDVRVIDCTTHMSPQPIGPSIIKSGRPDYERVHIPGATHVDMVKDLSDSAGDYPYTAIDTYRFSTLKQQLGIKSTDHVVLYGYSGISTITRAWFIFYLHGHKRLSILDGGMINWLAMNLPTSSGSSEYNALEHPESCDQRINCLATRQQVHGALDTKSHQLINALAPEQFAGTGGAHYGRPGRIPESLNLPARSLIDPKTNRFLDEPTLRLKVAQAGISLQKPSIHYCGGGIAATTSAFVMHLLDAKDWYVYDNSLLEWSQFEECPMQCDA